MVDVLVWDDGSSLRNSYGGMLDRVLSATGFGSIDFTPINIDQTVAQHVNAKRRKLVDNTDHSHRFACGICAQTFSVKKSRDRHRESIHAQQQFACHLCHRVFTRKDMRTRHQNEKHGGRRRSRSSISHLASAPLAIRDGGETGVQRNDQIATCRQRSSTPVEFEARISASPASIAAQSVFEADEDDVEELEPTASPLTTTALDPINNALLLCTHLLLRSNPYRRYFIDDRQRALRSHKRWRQPGADFWESYGLALHALRLGLASQSPDAELLAAVAAFVNVDVLINGSERMGLHARALYAYKAHHRSRRDRIFDALEAAFKQCGNVCRTVRIIYTKDGFVWMLNMGYRCLKIPVD